MHRAALLCWLGLVSSACAVIGYDFGDYQRASSGNSNGGVPSEAATALAGEAPLSPEPTPFGVAGAPFDVGGAPSDIAGAPGATEAQALPVGGEGGAAGCVPLGCLEQAVECGPATDGCGRELDCGGCFWWFLECRQNACVIVE